MKIIKLLTDPLKDTAALKAKVKKNWIDVLSVNEFNQIFADLKNTKPQFEH